MLMGSLLQYSSIAIFVVASYDMEAAQTFCQDPATPSCNTALNPNAYDPRVAGNLYPAPYMDYFCVIIWLFAGGIVSARGEIIQAEIQAKEREAALLKDLASSAERPSPSLRASEVRARGRWARGRGRRRPPPPPPPFSGWGARPGVGGKEGSYARCRGRVKSEALQIRPVKVGGAVAQQQPGWVNRVAATLLRRVRAGARGPAALSVVVGGGGGGGGWRHAQNDSENRVQLRAPPRWTSSPRASWGPRSRRSGRQARSSRVRARVPRRQTCLLRPARGAP